MAIFPVQVSALCNGVTGSVSPWVTLNSKMSTLNTMISVLLPTIYFEQMVVMRYTARIGFVGYTPKDVRNMANTGRSVAIPDAGCLSTRRWRNRNDKEESSLKKFGQMMTHEAVHLLSIFLLVYIGVEVTIGGWTASFLMLIRDGGPSSGYVSTGFFGGLSTLGRIILFPITDRLGAVKSKDIFGSQSPQQ